MTVLYVGFSDEKAFYSVSNLASFGDKRLLIRHQFGSVSSLLLCTLLVCAMFSLVIKCLQKNDISSFLLFDSESP